MSREKTQQPEILEEILDGLTHILCSDDITPNWVGHSAVKASSFDGFEVVPRIATEAEWSVLASQPWDTPVWPFDVCIAGGSPNGGWWFHRMATRKPSSLRSKARFFSNRMVESSAGSISDNAGFTGVSQTLSIFQNRVIFSESGRICSDDSAAFHFLGVAGGLALRRRYLWSVLLGERVGPRARFVTDPIGVREAFRLRDIPPGRQRRAALLHWVKSHWRQRRAVSAEDKSFVRDYLRGAQEFTWNGLGCRIEPSGEDSEKATDRHETKTETK